MPRRCEVAAVVAATTAASLARSWQPPGAAFAGAKLDTSRRSLTIPSVTAEGLSHSASVTGATSAAWLSSPQTTSTAIAGALSLAVVVRAVGRKRSGAVARCVSTSTAPTSNRTEEATHWAKFTSWLAERGGNIANVEIARVDGVRGLIASRDIEIGESIVEIPIEASIDISDPTRDEKDPSAPAMTLLKCFQDDSGELEPYFALLPAKGSPEMQCMPDFFPDEVLQMLQCPLVVEKTQKRRDLCSKVASESSVETEDLQWALCTVAQRAFSVLSPVDGLLRLMLPGIDLFNHDAHAQHTFKVRWNLDGYVTATFKVVAGSPIKKGEEVRICYGGSPFRADGCGGDCHGDVALTNAQYLQRYGFVDQCIGTTMVDGKWLVSENASSVRNALAQTSPSVDEELLRSGSLPVADRTAITFRQHLKRALVAQQEADAQAAKVAAAKSDQQRKEEAAAKKAKEEEAAQKKLNADEARTQLITAISDEKIA